MWANFLQPVCCVTPEHRYMAGGSGPSGAPLAVRRGAPSRTPAAEIAPQAGSR